MEYSTHKYTKNYSARKAILNALYEGRILSQLDCREFKVEDMRTPISHLKKQFNATHELKWRWQVTSVNKARIKMYWLEKRTPCGR